MGNEPIPSGLPVKPALGLPLLIAMTYLVVATSTSMTAAHVQGRLWSFEQMTLSGGRIVRVAPLIENLSTLADFVILNPIVIFFLLRAHQNRADVYKETKAGDQIPLYHRIGLTILALGFGVGAMKVYVGGFDHTFDATMLPLQDGTPHITITGWIVFSWTALFISSLFYGCAEQAFYTNHILKLGKADLPYRPLHHDGAGGVRFLMEPSLKFAYAMIGLLLIFAVFILHDRILYHITDSNRLWGFGLYLSIIVPLFFLPFWHLHTLMTDRRDDYLFEISGAVDEIVTAAKALTTNNSTTEIQRHISSMDYIEKYRKTIGEFPIWPLPMFVTVPPIGSVFAALVPLVQKLVGLVLARIEGLP